MNRVAISAAVGVLVAGAVFAAPYAGVHIPLATMVLAAGALSMGAASAVLTSALLTKPSRKSPSELLTGRLADSGLILKFPKASESMALSVRPDTRPDLLDVVKNPAKYSNKDIVVWLRGAKDAKFNPVVLKQLFVALSGERNFVHIILTAKNDEYIGYIPASYARLEFCGPQAESKIAKYVVGVFDDTANSANLREIGGAGKFDTINDNAEVAEAIKRMSGGFKRLVVLHQGYHRKPVGLVDFSDVMSGALTGTAPKGLGNMKPDMRW